VRWFGLTMLYVATVFAGGACGSDPEQKDTSEQSPKVEEAAKEREQGADDNASADCQLGRAEADLGEVGAEQLVNEWYAQEMQPHLEEDFASALEEAKDLSTFLAERGYVC
jgi:hypothetical protein